MALVDVFETLLLHQVKGDVELEHDRHGGRPGGLARFGAGLVSGQVEVELGHLRHGRGFPRTRRDGHEGQSGSDHPGLLRTADDYVELPVVRLERNCAEAADGVDDDQRVGRDILDDFGQLVDRVGDGSRGLVLGHQDGLPRTAGPEGLADPGRLGGLAPFERQLGHVGAVDGGDLGETIAERADGHGQDLVAGGQEADDRRLETAGARRGDDQDVVLRPKERLQTGNDAVLQDRELGTPVVDHLVGARFADGVRNGCRARDAQVGLEAVHGSTSTSEDQDDSRDATGCLLLAPVWYI